MQQTCSSVCLNEQPTKSKSWAVVCKSYWLSLFTLQAFKPLTVMGQGFLMMLKGGGLIQPAPSRSQRINVKNHLFFDFLKVYNKLGKANKS